MNRLAILGAGGHGRVVAEAAVLDGCESIVFYDDAWPALRETGAWPVVGDCADILSATSKHDAVVVAIGHNRTRLAKQAELAAKGLNVVSIVHPSAVMSPSVRIGPGCVVLAGAVVNSLAVLGSGCIINTGATVDHDCALEDGVHVSPGAHLGGNVRVGVASWIGIGAAVRHGITIGADVIVGAGAAVVSDVDPGATVAGVPARVVAG